MEWRAISFSIDKSISVSKVRAYVRGLITEVRPDTKIVAEIRSDNAGRPAQGILAVAKKPINATTMSSNWLNLEFSPTLELSPGKYWVVMKLEQPSGIGKAGDRLYLHYGLVDTNGEGNAQNEQMILNFDDSNGNLSETVWTKLPYDKTYAITIHGQ
jgi:hypothetical protein